MFRKPGGGRSHGKRIWKPLQLSQRYKPDNNGLRGDGGCGLPNRLPQHLRKTKIIPPAARTLFFPLPGGPGLTRNWVSFRSDSQLATLYGYLVCIVVHGASVLEQPIPRHKSRSCSDTSNLCTHYWFLSMEVHRSPLPNRVPESSRDGRVRKGPPVRGKETPFAL